MRLDEAQALLDSAAESTMQRIRLDRQAAAPKIQPLLEHLEQYLFDPGLNVTEWYRACGYRDHSVSGQFRQALGRPPKEYLEDCRLETAGRLLLRTSLSISEIGYLVGYSSPKVFSRAFDRWQGTSAASYREHHAEQPEHVTLPAEHLTAVHMQRAIRGQLEDQEVVQLVERMRLLYPKAFVRRTPATETRSRPVPVDGREYEQFMAERLWRRLRTMTDEEQRSFVCHQVSFRSTALFELLLRKSREEGRKDRQVGIRLAELALASVEGSAETLEADPAALRARAWAWIGNARRLALDFHGADGAFHRGDLEWSMAKNREDLLPKAEVLYYRAVRVRGGMQR